MICQCPSCMNQIQVPKMVLGKAVRCPICRTTYRAETESPKVAIQVQPTNTSRSASHLFASEDLDETAESRSIDDKAGDGNPVDDERVTKAKERTRIARCFTIGTATFVLVNVALNLKMYGLAQAVLVGNDRVNQTVVELSTIVVFGPLLSFVYASGVALQKLGARGLIIAGIVMKLVLFLILGGGLALNVIVLQQGNIAIPLGYILPTVVMNSVSCALILISVGLNVKILFDRQIRDAFIIQAELAKRQRRCGDVAESIEA